MAKRLKKFEYTDFHDEKNLYKLREEIRRLIKRRCKLNDMGDLPVDFMLRSRHLHYPFSDVFLISTNDKEIERSIELQASNLNAAMSRLSTLFQLKTLIVNEKRV